MFCLMDVSGSMSEHMKDLAKRFYMLLYVFLKRRYRHVEIVFIRHTDRAEEVDEDTFFHGPASGGTLVSSALKEMHDIVRSRFRPADWNIYAAQASDGDNSYADGEAVSRLLTEMISPSASSLPTSRWAKPMAARSRCPIRRCGRCISGCMMAGRRCRSARSPAVPKYFRSFAISFIVAKSM